MSENGAGADLWGPLERAEQAMSEFGVVPKRARSASSASCPDRSACGPISRDRTSGENGWRAARWSCTSVDGWN